MSDLIRLTQLNELQALIDSLENKTYCNNPDHETINVIWYEDVEPENSGFQVDWIDNITGEYLDCEFLSNNFDEAVKLIHEKVGSINV